MGAALKVQAVALFEDIEGAAFSNKTELNETVIQGNVDQAYDNAA